MNKLLAAIVTLMFAFGTTAVIAAEKEMKKDAPKVDCKDKKNKDNAACKPAPKKADKK